MSALRRRRRVAPPTTGRSAVVCLALLLFASSVGCSVGRAMVAPQADHAAYRRYRTAETLEQRLGYAWRYVTDHGGGFYEPPVRAWFERAEPIYWAVQSKSPAGLEGYLRAMPDGPHADAAIELLTEERVLERRRAARRSAAEAALARIEAEQSEREQVARLPLAWLELLLEPSAWSGPLDDASGPFLVRWRLEPPRPICFWDDLSSLHRCTKSMVASYPVVRDGEIEQRELVLSVELELDVDWQLEAARIFGPKIFLRAAEALARRPLDGEPRAAMAGPLETLQQGAIRRTDQLGLACDEPTRSGRWSLECDSLRVVLELGTDDEDDVVVVGRPKPIR